METKGIAYRETIVKPQNQQPQSKSLTYYSQRTEELLVSEKQAIS
jgi:hypothetical protein